MKKILVLLLAAAAFSCSGPFPLENKSGGVQLTVAVAGAEGRALEGDLYAVTVRASRTGYTDITGNLTYDSEVGLWTGTLSTLGEGEYTFTAEGKNSDGVVIYAAQKTQTLTTGTQNLTMTLLSQSGSFTAVVDWPAETAADTVSYRLVRTGFLPVAPLEPKAAVRGMTLKSDVKAFAGNWTLKVELNSGDRLVLKKDIPVTIPADGTRVDLGSLLVDDPAPFRMYWYHTGDFTPKLHAWRSAAPFDLTGGWVNAAAFAPLTDHPGWWVIDLGQIDYYGTPLTPEMVAGLIVKGDGDVKLSGPEDQFFTASATPDPLPGTVWGWNRDGNAQWFTHFPFHRAYGSDAVPPGSLVLNSVFSDSYGKATLNLTLPGDGDVDQFMVEVTRADDTLLHTFAHFVEPGTAAFTYTIPGNWFAGGGNYTFTARALDRSGNKGPESFQNHTITIDPINVGLLNYWSLYKILTPGTARDVVAGEALTIDGPVPASSRFGAGASEGSHSFDGADDSLYSTGLGLSGDNTWSLAFWIKDDSTTAATRRWFTNTTDAFGTGSLSIREEAGGAIGLWVDGVQATVTSNPAWKDGQWHLVTIVSDGNSTKAFLDKTEVGSIAASIVPRSGMYFGGWYDDGLGLGLKEFFHGSLDDIRTYNRPLTAADQETLYTEGGWTPVLLTMVDIPAGTFNNGTADVTLSAFKMSRTEVTQAQYEAVMGTNPSYFSYPEYSNHPVERVSWYDALVFANKLSLRENLTPVYSIGGSTDPVDWGTVPTVQDAVWDAAVMDTAADGYRLPTEAQWEYAARGGEAYTYAGSDVIDDVAWYDLNSSSTTHPVAAKAVNAYGLYDMSGNVWEWCWDWSGSYITSAQTDPTGPNTGATRISRGGCFSDNSTASAVSFRVNNYANFQYTSVGFRLVQFTPPLLTMVDIPAGTFNNGTADVTLSAFKMSRTEVTQAQYEAVMGTNPSYFSGNPSNPVEQVSWYDALVFANKLSLREGLTPVYSISGSIDPAGWGTVPTSQDAVWDSVVMNSTADGYRLPTEAQWEYAARGGESYVYAGSDNINEVAWYAVYSGISTYQVATKNANAFGLYDMSGNVWEKCWDWYDTYFTTAQTDPIGPDSGSGRVSRGGSWAHIAAFAAVSYRTQSMPVDRNAGWGFRMVRP